MKYFLPILFTFLFIHAQAQEADSAASSQMAAIEVRAYGQIRKLKDVPAAVNFIGQQTLTRFSPAAIVQAVNTTAGVRMEERSPGSYRFKIGRASCRERV